MGFIKKQASKQASKAKAAAIEAAKRKKPGYCPQGRNNRHQWGHEKIDGMIVIVCKCGLLR